MILRLRPLTAALAVAFSASALSQSAPPATMLDNVTVNASRPRPEADPTHIDHNSIAAQRAATSDTASLLRDVPGLSLNSAGGVSSLPSLHGMADDRIRTSVDGMDLIAACGNHMNPPLSYIDPTNIDSVSVHAGISPVSYGGDSIAGTIRVKSRDPKFAAIGQGLVTSGELGGFYRSNGKGWGANVSANIASENLSIRYSGSTAESGNYKAAGNFKAGVLATGTTAGSHWIPGDEVGSTAFKSENHALDIAYKLDNHLIDLKLGYQNIPYQGFPNQHMDMLGNEATRENLRYLGKYSWGSLEVRAYHEQVDHYMNFSADKLNFYGTVNNLSNPASQYPVYGMPMYTKSTTHGLTVQGEIDLNSRDLLRVGALLQSYKLNDWWPPAPDCGVGNCIGGMAPLTFNNINDGQRDRQGLFGEWEAKWNAQWTSLLGLRLEKVTTDTGTVSGYTSFGIPGATNMTMMGMPYGAMYAGSSAGTRDAFNAMERKRSDTNWDLSLTSVYRPKNDFDLQFGYARKTRSPSLYERYAWSTNAMAMTMNDVVNDGNGYVGNPNLKPEVANTLSTTASWNDAPGENWGISLTPYYSLVKDYIDAKRCGPSTTTCVKAIGNLTSKTFVYLTYDNYDAPIYGIDLSGFAGLGRIDSVGSFTARGLIGYINGKNRTTGDKLYNIMPFNARLALEHRLGGWSNTVESQLVSGKHDISAVRNEMQTKGYGLLNLRSSYEWKNLRFDLGLENALNKQYALPLGGAYIGQGTTMSLNGTGASYGVPMPGMGRSLYAGMNIKF